MSTTQSDPLRRYVAELRDITRRFVAGSKRRRLQRCNEQYADLHKHVQQMYEAMVRERGMLRRALGEYENDSQVAARYEAMQGSGSAPCGPESPPSLRVGRVSASQPSLKGERAPSEGEVT